MKRLRSVLATGSLVIGAGTAALVVSPSPATAAGTLDVYNVKANAAPLEIAVKTGYSFVAYPDSQMPRAAAFIEGGQVFAVASPADPGDSVDTLPGLLLPQGESAIASALTDPNQLGRFPSPFKDVFAKGAAVITDPALSPTQQRITTPYEHVLATYPVVDKNGNPTGRQTASFPLGLGVDPQVADPTGAFAVDAAAGRATADKDLAIAEAGAGSAVSVPGLNLSIGRVSSHSEVHGLGNRATSDAVSTVQNFTLMDLPGVPLPQAVPPLPAVPTSTPLLHIDSIVTTLHSERASSAGGATGTYNISYGGVSVYGHAANIDTKGIHIVGNDVASLDPAIAALNQMFAAANTVGGKLPTVGTGQTIVPSGSMAGPIITPVVSHNNNEESITASGLTFTLNSTIMVPSQTTNLLPPDPKNPPTLVPSAVTYTVTLATASSSAYGYSFPADLLGGPASVAPLDLGGSSGLSGGNLGGGGGGVAGSTGSGGSTSNSTSHPGHSALVPAAAWFDPRRLGRGAVVALGTLAEMLMLGSLIACYRSPGSRRLADAAKADLNLA